jgi:hypothetical protein
MVRASARDLPFLVRTLNSHSDAHGLTRAVHRGATAGRKNWGNVPAVDRPPDGKGQVPD